MTEKNFETIFKDALGQYEADVNPSVWQSVQSGLAGKGAAVSGAAGASKAAGTFAGLGVKGLLWIASAALISGAGMYWLFSDSASTENRGSATTTEKTENKDTKAVETKLLQDQSLFPETPRKPGLRENKPAAPAASQAPVSAETKEQPVVKAMNPVSSDKTVSPVNQKTEESVSGAAPKADETVKPVASETNPSEPAVPSAAAAGDPSFDQIENYLLQTQSGDARLPNHFTPDGDGINDVFTLRTTGLKSLEVTLFKQGGLIVAKWNDLHGSWNGVLPNGKNADAGTYYYSVTAITAEGKICIAQSTLILSR